MPLRPALRAAAAFALAAGVALALPAASAKGPAPLQDGTLSCGECHEETADATAKSIHAKVVADPALDGCEMCHVGKEGHLRVVQGEATGPKPPRSGFAKPVDCLLCHATIPARHEKEMPAWKEMKGAACTTCHDPHAPAETVKKARTTGPFADGKALEAAGAKPAGQAACAKCHDAPVKAFKGSTHAAAGATCEACHGNGSLHAAAGGVKRLVLPMDRKDAGAQARFCLACHEKDAPDHARSFAGSTHAEGGRTCASCHRVHATAVPAPKEGFARLADAVKAAKPVGSARCAECHKDPHPALGKSRHAAVMAAGREGCEGCHGPGGAHAAAGGRKSLILAPARLEAADRDALCLRCHASTSSTAAWGRTAHGGSGMACLQCHDPFAPAGKPAREPEPALCAKCHGTQVALFRLPNHHPVNEGAMKCSDCHDLHRPSPAVFSAKRTAESCAKCHRTEAAVRLHPHEAGRADGCVACHEPHGTASPRLLRFGRVVDLCLSCHVPPASHDLAPGSAYASCLACHTEIHGSDADRKLLR
jgi:DmsE family decaheme c-type cytochrome